MRKTPLTSIVDAGCTKSIRTCNDPALIQSFALSVDVYRALLAEGKDQCVIISGESGAGKTEAAKIFMNMLAAISKSSASVDRVKEQLLQSNPILEAFGNAKTLRNDNSSRFGKYMEIQFTPDGIPRGGRITNYLLEKSRIVYRQRDERSFHIFYNLLKGLPDGELRQLDLTRDFEQFHYLALGGCHTVSTIDDVKDFKDVVHALNVLGFSTDEVSTLWKGVAAVLLLGNVKIDKDAGGGSGGASKIVSRDVIQKVCNQLQIPQPGLIDAAIISRTLETRGEKVKVLLNLDDATYSRDSLSKAIYAALFQWLVTKLNESLNAAKAGDTNVIGILDIYGFEVFDNNSFEQFCINLCNEKLQQLFIELTLKSEQEEYVREGIKWTPIEYFNNAVICQLIEGKGGIINIMDDCCAMSDTTNDKHLLVRLDETFKTHQHYKSFAVSKDKSCKDNEFRIEHYAGPVTYRVDGMLVKNKDTLFRDAREAVQSSKNPHIAGLFPPVDDKKKPPTAGWQFRAALQALMDKLLACHPHYIRTMKPNDEKRADHFVFDRVRHQVRYLGLLENVRVRRAGFCFRQTYTLWLRRYKMIAKETWPTWRGNDKAGVQAVLRAHPKLKEGTDYQFGTTKLFIREPTTLFYLESERDRILPKIVTSIQTRWRGYIARKNFKRLVAAVQIQKYYRGYEARLRWEQLKSVFEIQMWYRRYRAVRYLQSLSETFARVDTQYYEANKTAWPAHPKILDRAEGLLQRVLRVYRAYRMITPLSAEQQEVVKMKIRTADLFEDQKWWEPAREFQRDYFKNNEDQRVVQTYPKGYNSALTAAGNPEVLFAANVMKISRKQKPMPRSLIVTSKGIEKHVPVSFKQKRETIPMEKVRVLVMSHHEDPWVVLKTGDDVQDFVMDFGQHGFELASEFAVRMKDFLGTQLEILFVDRIDYNNSKMDGKPGTVYHLDWKKADLPKRQTAAGNSPSGSFFEKGKASNLIIYTDKLKR